MRILGKAGAEAQRMIVAVDGRQLYNWLVDRRAPVRDAEQLL